MAMKICLSPCESKVSLHGMPECAAMAMMPKIEQAVCMKMSAMRVVNREPSCFRSDMAVIDPIRIQHKPRQTNT
eukprot:scaffold988_cov165-Ochromonas_danica.AAC.13